MCIIFRLIHQVDLLSSPAGDESGADVDKQGDVLVPTPPLRSILLNINFNLAIYYRLHFVLRIRIRLLKPSSVRAGTLSLPQHIYVPPAGSLSSTEKNPVREAVKAVYVPPRPHVCVCACHHLRRYIIDLHFHRLTSAQSYSLCSFPRRRRRGAPLVQ